MVYFFASLDPALPIKSRIGHTNFKVARFLRNAIRISKEIYLIGVDISIYEQVIVCQVKHPNTSGVYYNR